MGAFYQGAAGVLLAVLVVLILRDRSKEIGLMIVMAVCCMVLIMAAAFLEPVMAFLKQLQTLGDLDTEMMRILCKAVSIAFIAEIAGLICKDAGSESMAKALGILGSAVILWLSIPVFQRLLELIQQILGGI